MTLPQVEATTPRLLYRTTIFQLCVGITVSHFHEQLSGSVPSDRGFFLISPPTEQVRTVPVGDPRPLIRGEERGYYSMWSMRDIFFRVEGWEEGWHRPVPPAEEFASPKLTQIWPVQRPVASWPGNYALTLDDVLDLSRPRIV